LKDGINSTAIHGNKSQAARTKALADFKKGAVRILVATDIAARGLDIDSLPHVVNFDLPNVPEDYVHRIGRTGRAGASGMALSLVASEERDLLRNIQKLLGRNIEVQEIPGFKNEASFSTDAAPTFRQDRRPQGQGRKPGGFGNSRPARRFEKKDRNYQR
jgi:ATP-dependent RNA helicase RhlE